MAYGRPVVATAVGGLVGVVGIHVDPGDVPALHGAIESLLADPERRRRLGADARRAAQERVEPRAAANALARLYESVV
jgi:glycosyltransferase involved in cell wall biosynthesis